MGTRTHINPALFFLLIMIMVVSACAGRGKTAEIVIPKGSTLVTVIDYRELDGCEFLLEMEDGQKLQPLNLEERFKKAGIRLYITYKRYDGVGICMAGTMVTLSSQQEALNNTQ